MIKLSKLFITVSLLAIGIFATSVSSYAQRGSGIDSSLQVKKHPQLTGEILGKSNDHEEAFRTGKYKEFSSFTGGGIKGSTDIVGPVLQQAVGDETTYSDLESLLDDKVRTVSWPPPPRVWVESYIEEYHSQKVFVGPLSVPNITANLTNEFQYRVVTSFLMFGSLRDSKGATPLAKSRDGSTTPSLNDQFKYMPEMRHFTYASGPFGEAYPNTTADHPMVGMCAFQLTHRIALSEEYGIKIVAVGASDEKAKIRGVNFAFFSNFFPLDRNKSIDWYSTVFCNQGFAKYVKPSIEEDFRRTTQSMVRKQLSSCTPPDTALPVNPKGDDSCALWYSENYSYPYQHRLREDTVPRCMANKFGIYSCKIVAKENKSCPVYYNANDGKFYDTYQGLYSQTQASTGFECDHKAGLSCEIGLKFSLDLGVAGSHGVVSGSCKKGPRSLQHGKGF